VAVQGNNKETADSPFSKDGRAATTGEEQGRIRKYECTGSSIYLMNCNNFCPETTEKKSSGISCLGISNTLLFSQQHRFFLGGSRLHCAYYSFLIDYLYSQYSV
jgi:hypothetical protein